MMNSDQVRKQSIVALKQWGKDWREAAKIHSRFKMKDLLDFQNIGIGKSVLVIANGYSFEENLDCIKRHADNVDILCVDKSLKACIENGITPKYVIACDRHVSFSDYLEPVKDKLQDTVLFMNVCGNPEWSSNGNWKDIRFFVNKDCLGSEHEFSELSGCNNFIAAGTNVSNAAIVLLTQCDNEGRRNFFGYDKLLMIGFDYCWDDDKYYAFNPRGNGKVNYMRGAYCYNLNGDLVYTSTNLLFSAKWLETYIKAGKLPAIQCSRRSIVRGFKVCTLEEQLKYKYRPQDSQEVISLVEYRRELASKIAAINDRIFTIGRDHYKELIRTT
jgi:hypothetical protein